MKESIAIVCKTVDYHALTIKDAAVANTEQSVQFCAEDLLSELHSGDLVYVKYLQEGPMIIEKI